MIGFRAVARHCAPCVPKHCLTESDLVGLRVEARGRVRLHRKARRLVAVEVQGRVGLDCLAGEREVRGRPLVEE